MSGANGEIPAIRLPTLARWFEIGIRIVAKGAWFCLTMFPAASSHHLGEAVYPAATLGSPKPQPAGEIR